MNLLQDLNPAQSRAAMAPPGPWLVLAGPGTGKTRTLVARIFSLINNYKIKSSRLMAVTYTNKATEEMRTRLNNLLGENAADLTISTFHGYCISILREYHDLVGLAKHFTIADADCQLRAMARIAPNIAGERHLRFMLTRLSGARLNPDEIKPLSAFEQQIQRKYEVELHKNCLIDFDDILFYTQRLFFEYPQILQRCRRSFEAILVDEFQDTDRVQYEIIKQLVKEHNNLFVVADDDQSIFSWRGANPSNIDLFKRDFAGDQVILLTENYRSRSEIIDQAKSLILQNPGTKLKLLRATRKDANDRNVDDAVRVEHFDTDSDEANFILREIKRQMSRSPQLTYADFAILYARHALGEFLERELMKADLPCQLVRGKSCFDQPEIVRTLHLLRVLHNPKDQYSLEEFVAHEVDEVTYTRLKTFQREEDLPDFRITLDRFRKRNRIPEQERKQIEQIIGRISNLMAFKDNGNKRLSDLFAEILNSLTNQEILNLKNRVEKLTDPLFYQRMREVTKIVYDAREKDRPVLISASDERINFLGREILKRGLGITAITIQDFVTQQLATANKKLTADKESSSADKDQPVSTPAKPPVSPLIIALDGNDLNYISAAIKNSPSIIYLGIDYSPERRAQLHSLNAIVINPEELTFVERGFEFSSMALLFKLCQATSWIGTSEFLSDYVALDIETTDRDTETNDIIELAAIRVRNNIPGEHFRTLVKASKPIAIDAAKVHGLTDEDLETSPTFAEIADQFLAFIGNDVLLAHNGYNFDFPVLRRKLREVGRPKFDNRVFDTLPMAARLFPDRGASLDALASVFEIDAGQRHRAYDDTFTLIEIFERLKKEYASRQRRTACEQCIDLVGAGMVLEQSKLIDTHAILVQEGLRRLAMPGSTLIERLSEFNGDLTLLKRLVDEAKMEQPRDTVGSADRFAAFLHLDEIVSRFDGEESLEASIQQFLDFASLYQQQDGINRRNAINLMTIYAAKGLEFDRVFIVGLEQNVIPSFYAIGSKNAEQIAEQRRLLYVAITRAKEQLIITTAGVRNGYPQMVSDFLLEMLAHK